MVHGRNAADLATAGGRYKIPSAVNKTGRRAFTSLHYADFDVPSEDIYDADGKLVAQILSTGRQTVIPPSIHPETKLPYHWTNGASCYDTRLTELSPLPRDYREQIMALGYAFGGRKPKPDISTDERENGLNDNPCAELNAVALKNLPAWVPALNLYKCQAQRGRYRSYRAVATWRESMTGRKLEERDLNLSICSSGIKDFGDKRTYSPLDLVMAARGTSLEEAFCWLEEKLLPQKPDIEVDWEKIAETQDAPNTAPEDEVPPGNGDDGANSKSQFKGYDISPYRVRRGSETEPRDWVAYKHYLRGTVSTTVGPGAGGKTSLDMVEAYSMALGRDLLETCKIARPYSVWYHNAEETMKELDRRFAALREYYEIEEGAESDRLFVTCGFDLRIRATDKGKKLDMATYQKILHTIEERGIEVAVFDPLTAMHNREETNDGLGELMYDFFGPIANQTRAAIEIVHHTRKGPPGIEIDYGAIDARGGGAFIFAVRSGRVVNPMKKAEAETYGIDEADRFSYFRVGRDKPNMVKRGLLGWFKIESQVLKNARPDEGKDNEDVGVVDSWTPPEAQDPLAMYGPSEKEHWRELAANNPNYGYHANSRQWFGDEIAKSLKLDMVGKRAKKNKKIVTAILDDLIEEGVLQVVNRRGEDRHDHQYVSPGNAT
jgi:hypothetical protein